MTRETLENEPYAAKSLTVGLIAALVAEQTPVTNLEALQITRRVVGRYARAPLSDSTIQEITLQAIAEARTGRTPEEIRELLSRNVERMGISNGSPFPH